MGAEKVATKGGGFFHLFDWNRKSRKKLFANGTVSPEGTKQARKNYDNLPAAHLRLVGDDDVAAVSSIKENSDYSCASSVTDEDGNGIRAPGVVARLMGLDSMPTAGTLEPYSSPLFQPQSLRERQYQKSTPEFEINNQFINVHNNTEVYSTKPQESKAQRMPSSPIERFQTEMLPPRSAKSLPLTHYKLLSPIKNPRFISSKDAAHIMEAAAKILEPGNHPNSSIRTPSVGSSSVPLRVHDPKECMASTQRMPRPPESSKRPVESNSMKYLRGKPLSKSWNGSESDTSCRASPDREEANSITAKSKGKSISLAIQAKVNVQRRKGLGTPSRTPGVQKEQEEFKSGQPFRNQTNHQKDRLQKKASGPTASGVLKQNNQKQNCLINKDKLVAIPSGSNSQGRKAFSRDASSSARTKTLNKPQGNSNGGYRRKVSQTINLEKEASSSTVNNLARNKRTKVDHDSEKSGCINDILAGRHEKRIQHNVIIDEQPKQDEDRRKNGMDVVSFTFTSPTVNHFSESQSIKMREKQDTWKDYYPQAPGERNPIDVNSKSHGLNMFSGDALSVLLEQKLRELTFGMESSQTNLGKGTNVTTASTSQDPFYASENSSAVTVESEKDVSWESCTDNDSITCDSGLSAINVQVSNLSHKLQETEVLEEFCSSDARKEASDHQHLSPFSILEPSFSYESCTSSESCDSGNGSMISSSVVAQGTACFDSKKIIAAVDAEMEVSDSASSSFKETIQQKQNDIISRNNHIKAYKKEVEYVKEILSAAKLNSKNFAVEYTCKTLNPLLFDHIEHKKNRSMRSEEKDGRARRKVLFDCVRECLDLKTQRYFSASYETWRKGLAVVGCGDFAEEIYKEIFGWSSMGDWMVDELVDKDMSSHLGKWLDFEPDAFKIGIEIESKILGTLINEVIAEFKV